MMERTPAGREAERRLNEFRNRLRDRTLDILGDGARALLESIPWEQILTARQTEEEAFSSVLRFIFTDPEFRREREAIEAEAPPAAPPEEPAAPAEPAATLPQEGPVPPPGQAPEAGGTGDPWIDFLQENRRELRATPGLWEWATGQGQDVLSLPQVTDVADIFAPDLEGIRSLYLQVLDENQATPEQFASFLKSGALLTRTRNQSAFFLSEFQVNKDKVLRDLSVSPEVSQWLDTPEGQQAMASLYARRMEEMRGLLEFDPVLGEAMPITRPPSPTDWLTSLDARDFIRELAKVDISSAARAHVRGFLEGLPTPLIDGLVNNLMGDVQSAFQAQASSPGGVSSLENFIAEWRPDPVSINGAIQDLVPDIGGKGLVHLGVLALGQDPLAALQQVAADLERGLGRPPGFSDILNEVARRGGQADPDAARLFGDMSGMVDPTLARDQGTGQLLTDAQGNPFTIASPTGIRRQTFSMTQDQFRQRQQQERVTELEGILGIPAGSGFSLPVLESEASRVELQRLRGVLEPEEQQRRRQRPFGQPFFVTR